MKWLKLALRFPLLIPLTVGESLFALFAWVVKNDDMAEFFLRDIKDAWTT